MKNLKKTLQNWLLPLPIGLTLWVAFLTIATGCRTESSTFAPLPNSANPARQVLIDGSPTVTKPAQSSEETFGPSAVTPARASYTLREGDTLKIAFPGSPNLNSVQQIRTDGKITLPLIGEVVAAELTPDELQKKLMDLYAPQLSSKEVIVEVQSSSFPVYITGAVLHPGKISSDHPITALEAIMEAGGPDYTKANLKNVEVIRQEGNQTRHYQLNLKQVMEGKSREPFYMKPSDIIYVPEKFSWF